MKYHIEEYELFNEKRIDAVLDYENPVLQDWLNDDFRQFHKWYMDDFKEVIDGKKENGGPSANMSVIDINKDKTTIELLFHEDDAKEEEFKTVVDTVELYELLKSWQHDLRSFSAKNRAKKRMTQKQQAACTYQWKYRKYVGKTIKLKLKDGDVLVGKVDSISSPGDNDNGEEGILLDTSIGLQEYFEHEIESVEVEST